MEEFSLLVEGQKEDREDADRTGTIRRVCLEFLVSFIGHVVKASSLFQKTYSSQRVGLLHKVCFLNRRFKLNIHYPTAKWKKEID